MSAATAVGGTTNRVVLDSGVLLALWDPADVQHHAAHSTLLRHIVAGNRMVVPVSMLSETLVGAFRATPYATRMVESFIDEMVTEVCAVDRAVGRAAARLRAEHRKLPLAEALLVATGEIAGACEILTADARLFGLTPRIRVLGG